MNHVAMPSLRCGFRLSFVRSCCFVQNDTRILVERGRNDIVGGGEDGELAVWISPDLTANRSFEARLARHIFRRLPSEQAPFRFRSEEHTSELQSLMRISYAVFCLKKQKT